MMMGMVDGNVASTAYVGPGDIVSGATAWYGLRAYSAATASALTNAVDIIRASDSTTQTFTVLATGALDIASITTFLASTTGKVSKLWDQTGNGNHLTQGTDANRPTFTLSGIGSLPVMTCASSAAPTLSGTISTISQPWTVSAIYNNTNNAVFQSLVTNAASGLGVYIDDVSGANHIELEITSDLVASATDGSWHAIQAVANGASSDMNVDGSATTGSVSATSWTTSFNVGGTSANRGLNGKLVEIGIWPSAFSSGNSTSMSTNQHSYWGF